MKLLKSFYSFFLILILTFNFTSCSDCKNENPRARITNMGTEEVSVQIKTTGGNTENLNNVEPGKSSEFRSYDSGTITFTIVVKDDIELVEIVEMDFCSEYEIIVNEDNAIITISTGIE
ncbi:hypothetical protein [uncultured Tenacibaculum sp.]|uniref:hypothetical protein n=1 Tax=uncultured Tenacibaculum sp. TaxID=174713 RepID=UPI002639A724|nr:hypothetical protein [uncultured Tenacibaculum sp.]